jgi:hypothetical protein
MYQTLPYPKEADDSAEPRSSKSHLATAALFCAAAAGIFLAAGIVFTRTFTGFFSHDVSFSISIFSASSLS